MVTDQRYGALVRAQVPDVRILVEPSGRNTAAAIALATLAIDRPDDEVMLVLPADQGSTWRARTSSATCSRTAAAGLATGDAFGVDDPLVTLGVRPPTRRRSTAT